MLCKSIRMSFQSEMVPWELRLLPNCICICVHIYTCSWAASADVSVSISAGTSSVISGAIVGSSNIAVFVAGEWPPLLLSPSNFTPYFPLFYALLLTLAKMWPTATWRHQWTTKFHKQQALRAIIHLFVCVELRTL